MIHGFEQVVRICLVYEAFPQLRHFRLEFLRQEDFVRQCSEPQVEVVREQAVLDLGGLGEVHPNTVHVSGE